MADGIRYEVLSGGVAVITLDRPRQRNAFTLEMIDAWCGFLVRAESDESIGAIVLTGANGSFCAGIDLTTIRSQPRTTANLKDLIGGRIHRIAYTLDGMSKPVIAAMSGSAVGAGLDMALMCDMRFAGRSATMSERYIRLGVVPGDGGAFFLPRIVGEAKALELLLSGDTIDAEEALRIGLVNRIHEEDELLPATLAFAARLAERPRLAAGMIKRAVRHSRTGDLRSNLDLISSHFGVVGVLPDADPLFDTRVAQVSSSPTTPTQE